MSYDKDADRTSMARVAIFFDKPRPGIPDPSTPNVEPPILYQCRMLDMCRTGDVPRFDWRVPGRNKLDIESLKSSRLDICFKDNDPDVALVQQWDVETTNKADFLQALRDVDALVLFQDVGKDQEEDEMDKAVQGRMMEVCGLVAESKGLYDRKKPIEAEKFVVPISVMAATMGGRVGNKGRELVKTLSKESGWIYTYIKSLDHESEIAQNIIELMSKVEKRGMYSMRLVPCLVRPYPPTKPTPDRRPTPPSPQVASSPPETPAARVMSPALAETPADKILPRDNTPPSAIALVTPGDPLNISQTTRSEALDKAMDIPSPSPRRSGSPHPSPGRRAIPPMNAEPPPLPRSTSSTSTADRPQITPKSSARTVPLATTEPQPTTAKQTGPKIRHPFAAPPQTINNPMGLRLRPIEPIPTGATGPLRPVRRNMSMDELGYIDETTIAEPYLPNITTAGEGSAFMASVERYRQGQAGSTSGSATPDDYFDMEGSDLRTRMDSQPKSSGGGGFIGRFGKARSIKGKDDKPVLKINTVTGTTTSVVTGTSTGPRSFTPPLIAPPPILEPIPSTAPMAINPIAQNLISSNSPRTGDYRTTLRTTEDGRTEMITDKDRNNTDVRDGVRLTPPHTENTYPPPVPMPAIQRAERFTDDPFVDSPDSDTTPTGQRRNFGVPMPGKVKSTVEVGGSIRQTRKEAKALRAREAADAQFRQNYGSAQLARATRGDSPQVKAKCCTLQ